MIELFAIIFILFLHYLVGLAGEKRTIGFKKSVIITLLLSPLVGIIVTLMYPKKKIDYNQMIDDIGKND